MPESGAPTRLVVAAAILDDPGRPRRVLAARRSGPAELAGRWEFPGGKVDPGETAAEALTREIAEELGVAIAVRDELTDGAPWPINPDWELRVWTAALTGGQPAPAAGDSHDRLRWLTRTELTAVDWLEPDRPAVALLDAILLD
ncbi:(deoxy)nucleoside triphosphate pyrophosphohydrolase [Microlunatus speluncae]|uniref:(deoxy)nucleoside triphosphate pyrophosphohydrolase n=1 Tax=Microlunatus speluncae TaxID=2594267 RepID=UPI001FEC1A7C|nr:(deoxy)nucleoside triphosphate pyrophosphohydrolase [Microlunatus speluncae]